MTTHKTLEGVPAKEGNAHFEARRQAVVLLEKRIKIVMRVFFWICVAVTVIEEGYYILQFGLPDALMLVLASLILPGILFLSYVICKFAFGWVIRKSWEQVAEKYEYTKATVTKKSLKFFTADATEPTEEIMLEDILEVKYDAVTNELRLKYSAESPRDNTSYEAVSEFEDNFMPPLREALMP